MVSLSAPEGTTLDTLYNSIMNRLAAWYVLLLTVVVSPACSTQARKSDPIPPPAAKASEPKKSLPKINKVDEPYWKGAAAGKLLLQKCKACGKLQFFPRVVCVDCFSGDIDWIEAKGTGRVHTFSWVGVPRNPAFKDDVPICYINVILDEGVIMESRLVGKGIENVKLGDKVKVAFQETHDPGIKLPVFELAG